ncbi:hypothetical protein EMIHUDRAFT_230975 [Emiliania huxleyi CCMP1516]|uniref:Uncharacterized protein n=2 Tax=Emiliania huxleyi TaxID=2903 RepID=A0A0D3K9H5_EMIH1|nr:hypothetical protein EMIHUDRAFT_230975 [Emiliania huxleyi CCMP1516]EOD32410.1 hypothetical protein EMIHUDRAFT_230975 [Emiliania huxleyi CCMP1516]|eukprot:XP_005784839.1 hypothetical protein EMIHUDRAFT_230975 [Emiliania huxleyi CCMP1516]
MRPQVLQVSVPAAKSERYCHAARFLLMDENGVSGLAMHWPESCPIKAAMKDFAQLFNHTSKAVEDKTYDLPPEPLVRRILDQIPDRPACDQLAQKYTDCRECPHASAERASFVRALRRLAESGITFLQRRASAEPKERAGPSKARKSAPAQASSAPLPLGPSAAPQSGSAGQSAAAASSSSSDPRRVQPGKRARPACSSAGDPLAALADAAGDAKRMPTSLGAPPPPQPSAALPALALCGARHNSCSSSLASSPEHEYAPPQLAPHQSMAAMQIAAPHPATMGAVVEGLATLTSDMSDEVKSAALSWCLRRGMSAFLAALPLQPSGLQASVLRRRVEAVERGPARPTATTHSAVKQEEPAQATPPL